MLIPEGRAGEGKYPNTRPHFCEFKRSLLAHLAESHAASGMARSRGWRGVHAFVSLHIRVCSLQMALSAGRFPSLWVPRCSRPSLDFSSMKTVSSAWLPSDTNSQARVARWSLPGLWLGCTCADLVSVPHLGAGHWEMVLLSRPHGLRRD